MSISPFRIFIGLAVAWSLSLQAYSEVVLTVGSTFSYVVSQNPAGTTYRIASGVHRLQSVKPKNGDTFFGENGAVMKGSLELNPALAGPHPNQVQHAGVWCWTGVPDLPASETMTSGTNCVPGFERETYWCCDLFVDGVLFRHQNSLAAVNGPGEWYYDDVLDMVHVYGDPAGKLVEVSKSRYAFDARNTSGVTIENLTIAQYASQWRPQGAILARDSNAVLRNLEVTQSHAAGICVGALGLVENCRITHSGQIGLLAAGKNQSPMTMRNNEIAFNRQLGYDAGEYGALKISECHGGLFAGNWVHDNYGFGVWYDVYNVANICRSNLIECAQTPNLQKRGIYYEISGTNTAAPASFSSNTIRQTGDSAFHFNDSQNANVFDNLCDTTIGIVLNKGDRPPGLDRIRVWGNSFRSPDCHVWLHPTVSPSMIERFDGNTYISANGGFRIFSDTVNSTFAQWRAAGYDANGVKLASGEPALPAWAIPFRFSHYGPLPNSRLVHLKLDEGAGSVAGNASGRAGAGSVLGNPVWVPGMRKGALQFDPSDGLQDAVSLGAAPGATAQEITVAFWMKPGSGSAPMVPLSKSPSGPSGAGWSFRLRDNGEVYFRVGSETNGSDLSAGTQTVGENWMHVAGTFSQGVQKIYINGELKNIKTGVSQTPASATADLRLGGLAQSPAEPFKGSLDDVLIFDDDVESAVVRSLVYDQEGAKPLASWSLDEAWGAEGKDSLGWHLALQNSPEWTPGKRGYGLKFSGTAQRAIAAFPAQLSVVGDKLTLAAWCYPSSVSGYRVIVSKSSNYELMVLNGKPRVEFRISNNTLFRAETTGVQTQPGSWCHLAAVRSGSNVSIYVNGVRVPVTYLDPAPTFPMTGNASNVEIGRRAGGSLPWEGTLDEVRVYNLALSQGEILGLVGESPFAEPSVEINLPTKSPAFATDAAFIDLAGVAGPGSGGLQSVKWTNSRGGGGLATGTQNWSVGGIPLELGLNVLTVTALGSDGLTHSDTIKVSRNPLSEMHGLRATYFHDLDLSHAAFSRVDPGIAFFWGSGSPHPSIESETFSARWEGTIEPTVSGVYTFTVRSDDGSRLWIGDTFLVNHWSNHGHTAKSGTIELVAGRKYPVRMEYYDHASGASVELCWTPPGGSLAVVPASALKPPVPQGLLGTYFDNMDFTGTSFRRLDPTVSFFWGGSAPDPRIDGNTFSVLWQGKITAPETGLYTFEIGSDDGSRLWIGGALVVSHWTDHGHTVRTGSIALTAGQEYPILMEFYENGSSASAELKWTLPSGAKAVVPAEALKAEVQ